MIKTLLWIVWMLVSLPHDYAQGDDLVELQENQASATVCSATQCDESLGGADSPCPPDSIDPESQLEPLGVKPPVKKESGSVR